MNQNTLSGKSFNLYEIILQYLSLELYYVITLAIKNNIKQPTVTL